jgi:pimeloyl-ACP methyl ester carboxylesterase
MKPIFFGPDARRLFGILSARQNGGAARLGVVLCNPFGREAIRAHRLYRVIGERLSRAGCDVLRFDYFGTGDSNGADDQVDLAGFARDLVVAHEELVRRTGVTRVNWMGMRLGASVVQIAAAASPALPARLILWDPVFDGRDYLDLLRRRHLEWQTADEDPITNVPALFRHDDSAYLDEAIGFPLPRAFCDQLRAHRLASLQVRGPRVTVLCDPDNEEGRAALESCRAAGTECIAAAHGTDWTREGDATGLVPPTVLNQLLEHGGAVS